MAPTESAGAAVAQAAEAPSPPAAAPANPTEVPPAPPAVPAAPAAPSQVAPPARKDWLNEEKLINAFLGAVVELPPEGIATILRFHGATRGHVDGCLGLARDPGKQAALLIALKEAGQRQRVGL